jgi:hypothetical protein
VKFPTGAVDLAVSTSDYRQAPVEVSGNLMDSRGRASRFSATHRQQSAEWNVARLDGKADLLEFAANFPGVPARLPAMVKLRSEFPEIAVRDFVYRPGQTPTVDSLRLVSPADVTVTVRGQAVAIDRLTGEVASANRGWKLSRVTGRVFGGQATVDGVYEKAVFRDATLTASNLRVAQLTPWLGDSQDSLGQAVLAVDYRGTLAGMDNAARITGAGRVRLENAPVVKIPLLDQTYALFSILSSPIQRRGSGLLDVTFSADQGIVTVSQFTARSDSARVTANGTIDLKKRQVDGRARGNIRGIFGLATTPLSRALEMKVSGPLNQIRVRPLGFEGVVKGVANILPDTVKKSSMITSDIVRNGIALPLRALEVFTPDAPAGSPKR